MLLIREEQMRVFREQSRNDFRLRLGHHFGLDEPDIAAALTLAKRFNLHQEDDIVRFAGILLTHFGKLRNIQLAKSLQNILLAYGVPATVRLDRFSAAL